MQRALMCELWSRYRCLFFSAGIAWFVIGMGLVPRNKNYQQLYLVLVVLPFFIDILLGQVVVAFFTSRKVLYFFAIFALVVFPAFYTGGLHQGWQTLKRTIFILAFLYGFFVLGGKEFSYIRRVVLLAYWVGGVIALVSILNFYFIENNSFYSRLLGLGVLDDPIMGAYAVSVMLIGGWCLSDYSLTIPRAVLFYCSGFSMFCYVTMTQSRGAFFALLIVFFMRFLFRFGRKERLASCVFGILFVLVIALFYPFIIERGVSFRPDIAAQALSMIGDHPWFGIGGDYKIYVPRLGMEFAHAHNMLLHIAIVCGLTVLVVWLAVWVNIFKVAWCFRRESFAGYVLAVWLYSTIAMQFDGARFIDTPRPEWLISWWVAGLYLSLLANISKSRSSCPDSR